MDDCPINGKSLLFFVIYNQMRYTIIVKINTLTSTN